MTDYLLGSGYIEITRVGAGANHYAFLLTQRKGAPQEAAPLDTTGLAEAVSGSLVARVTDTSTVPGLAWRRLTAGFVSEGQEHVITSGLPRVARRRWRDDPAVSEADSLTVGDGTDDFDLSGILHSRIDLLWRTAP